MEYKFKNVQRRCGHIEDVKMKTACSYEPTALKWAENDDCTNCKRAKKVERMEWEAKAIKFAVGKLMEAGFTGYAVTPNFDGKNVEITITIKVE